MGGGGGPYSCPLTMNFVLSQPVSPQNTRRLDIKAFSLMEHAACVFLKGVFGENGFVDSTE